jgi:hypothetical protein
MSPNDHIRTESEISAQRIYETKEASRHGSMIRIHYHVLEGVPPQAHAVTSKLGWRVSRSLNDGKKSISQWFYRKVEAIEYLKTEMRRDKMAASRLGVGIDLIST